MVRRAADVHEDKPKKGSTRFNEPPWRDSRGCTTITHDRSIHPSITCDPYNFSSVAPMLPSIEHSLDHSNDSKIIFHFFIRFSFNRSHQRYHHSRYPKILYENILQQLLSNISVHTKIRILFKLFHKHRS